MRSWHGIKDSNKAAIAATMCFLAAAVVLMLQYSKIGVLIQMKDVLHHEDIALAFTAFGLGLIWGSAMGRRRKVLTFVLIVSLVLLIFLFQATLGIK